MSSDGRNKRRYNWKESNRGTKRFHGTHEYNNDFNRPPVWDNAYHSQEPYANMSDRLYHSGGRVRNHYNRLHHNRYNAQYQNRHAFTPPISTESAVEQEESVVSGPGTESERQEKVLAIKKRLEEAFASKPSDGNHQEISFQDSAKNTDKVKTNDNILAVTGVDLRLTNSDFKEIGSVVTNVTTEGEVETSDIVLNVSPCIIQQRSFNNSCPSPASTASKSPRVGGWSVSSINEMVPSDEPVQSGVPKTGGEMYFQERRETILGNVIPSTSAQQSVDTSQHRQSTSNTNYQHRNQFSRVGRLYQSFLKSRLCGYTLKMSDKSVKASGPNPLLDKSVLNNQNANNLAKESESSIASDQVSDFVHPILIKTENDVGTKENTPEDIAAEEANEFCKEYSFLLTHPNFLIPPEDLDKFGLGHLSEMTRLLNERRNNEINKVPLDNQESLRVKSLNALNNVTEHDITCNAMSVNQPNNDFKNMPTASSSHVSANTNNLKEQGTSETNNKFLFDNGAQQQNISTQRNQSAAGDIVNQSPAHNSAYPSRISTPTSRISTASNVSTSDPHNAIVDTVVQRVMEKLLQSSSNTISHLRDNTSYSNIVRHDESIPSTSNQSSNQLQNINSKLLTMYLIDKQIEELTQEKMKIYNDILSAKEISSTLLNSSVQGQIQLENVKHLVVNANVHSNTSTKSQMPVAPDINLPSTQSGVLDKSLLQEVVSDLKRQKEEDIDLRNSILNNMMVDTSFTNNKETQDIVSSTSVTSIVENNIPKLSVRKDLHDPNITRKLFDEINGLDKQATRESTGHLNFIGEQRIPIIANSLDAQSEIFKDKLMNKQFVDPYSSENIPVQDIDPYSIETIPVQNNKEKKKKKKKKKEASNCVIDLVNVTSDEEMCSVSQEGSVTGIDPLASNELSPSVSNVSSGDLVNIEHTAEETIVHLKHNATCMVRTKNSLLYGSKEGLIIGLSLVDYKILFKKKIHSDAILCLVAVGNNHIMIGSANTSLSLFKFGQQNKLFTAVTVSSVQCLDFRFEYVFGGTKNGFLIVYKVVTKKKCMKLNKMQNPVQLTNSSIVALKAVKEESEFFVIIASRGEQITIRNILTGAILRTFDWCDTVYCLEVPVGSTQVYCGTNTKSVKVVDYSTGTNTNDCQVGRSVLQIVILGSLMFAACYDGKLYVYDVKNNKLITSLAVCKGVIVSIALFKTRKILLVDNKKKLHVLPIPEEWACYFDNDKKEIPKKKKKIKNPKK